MNLLTVKSRRKNAKQKLIVFLILAGILVVLGILAPLLTQGLKVKRVSDDRETPAGVYFMKNGKVRPATTIKHLRSGKGPQTFLTLVMPVRQRTCPVTALEESGDSAVIRFEDGRALRVTLPETVGGRLQTEWIGGK